MKIHRDEGNQPQRHKPRYPERPTSRSGPTRTASRRTDSGPAMGRGASETGAARPEFETLLFNSLRIDQDGTAPSLVTPPPTTHEFDDQCLLFWPEGHEPYVVALTRVAGMARAARTGKEDAKSVPVSARTLSGIQAYGASFVYLLFGQGTEIRLYVGIKTSGESASAATRRCRAAFDSLKTCLVANYTDIRLQDVSSEAGYQEILDRLGMMKWVASLAGNPCSESPTGEHPCGIDRVARALAGARYCHFVEASPIDLPAVAQAFKAVTSEIAETHKFIKQTTSDSTTSVSHESHEQLDRFAQHYQEFLEIACGKLQAGMREGMWRANVHLLTTSESSLRRAGSLLRAVFAGADSSPEPVRMFFHNSSVAAHTQVASFRPIQTDIVSPDAGGLVSMPTQTALCSSDLGLLVDLPRIESPGYSIRRAKSFALDVSQEKEKPIDLGMVVGPTGLSAGRFCISLNDLSRHTLIVGVTGAGKTNTALHLLAEVWGKYGVPFLVIEPAKAQYRNLLSSTEFRADLQVFAPGLGNIAPLRVNPFEFPAGVDPQAHIAGLYAVFNAAFILYAPMPYVLERAMYEVYEDRGWDLGAGRHVDTDRGLKKTSVFAFPTLTDLYYKIGEVVDRLGYDRKLRMDVTAGLQARIDSLRVGQKGSTLDTPVSVPFDVIFRKPTVLELSHIGNDEERAFLMGLLLMRLYEHLQVHGESHDLKHLTLVEEAHRLLARTSTETSASEVANVKGKAVEAFANILAEIRAYGEGLIVAEQIPSKLATEVVKNTNLKVMHRIVAADDRDLMAGAMNLMGSQKMVVSALARGQAAMYAEGMESPALVQVPLFHIKASASNADVQRVADKFHKSHPGALRPLSGCTCCRDVCRYGARAKRFAYLPGSLAAVWGFALSCLLDPKETRSRWEDLAQRLLPGRSAGQLAAQQRDDLAWCVFTLAGQQACWLLRGNRDVSLAQLEQILAWLARVGHVARTQHSHPRQDGTEIVSKEVADVAKLLRLPHGPWRGCAVCAAPCLYEPLGRILAGRPGLLKRFRNALDEREPAHAVGRMCLQAAQDALFTSETAIVRNTAICFFTHIAEQVGANDPVKDIKLIFGKKDRLGTRPTRSRHPK